MRSPIKLQVSLLKWRYWEYWPTHAIYAPLYLYWFWLSIKAKSLFFFNTSNPLIENGGFTLESKQKIYEMIPQHYQPKTVFLKKGDPNTSITDQIKKQKLQFPLIAKPNIGQQGIGVTLVHNLKDVITYQEKWNTDFLLQEYIDYANEVGVFYYKIPGTSQGNISGIVEKHYMQVTGDGVSTIAELMQKELRYALQLPILKNTHSTLLNTILPKDENKILIPFGNHSRGAKFLDKSDKINSDLEESMNKILAQIPSFYYGRLDIKFKSWELLNQGKDFVIIELNGAGSEPTHMYDPKHSIFFAWKEIIRHWELLYRISKGNATQYDLAHMSISEGVGMLVKNYYYFKSLG